MDLRIDLHCDVLCGGWVMHDPYSETIDRGTRCVVQRGKGVLVTLGDTR